MEGYQSAGEFCEDEFYNILETMSPFAATINEVEFCQKCKTAPCACAKTLKIGPGAHQPGNINKILKSSATEDYSISAELPPAKKTRTVGIVEPRVVVKIPWTKIGRKTLPQENYKMMMQVSTPMQETAPETIKVHQSNVGLNEFIPEKNFEDSQMEVLLVSAEDIRQPISSSMHTPKMKTNGSQNGHIQVDSQTIETALDDEVATFAGNESKRAKKRKANGKTTNVVGENTATEDLLDILDNFLITTSNADFSSHLTAPSRSTAPESITVSKNRRTDGSIKFTFEEEEGKQWMFCHVPGCSFWTSKSSRMERHKLCHSEPSELEVKRCYKCPDCHLKFYSLAKLLKHDRRKHTGIKDYECRICSAEVTDIQTHMRIHADEKNHFCEHCPLSFRHKSSLVRHMFLHTGERPYRCQSCQSSFTARDRLKGHILKHHPDHPAAQELVQQSKQNAAAEINEPPQPPPKRRKRKSSRQLTEKITESSDNNSRVTNFIVQWPATLQVGADGNLCWQAPATFDPAGGSFNEVSTVQPQIIIQQDQVLPNPLDVAIKEIIEVDQGSRFGGDKLSAVESVPKEESVFICDKCGREYKYKSFLQVHQKRKCW